MSVGGATTRIANGSVGVDGKFTASDTRRVLRTIHERCGWRRLITALLLVIGCCLAAAGQDRAEWMRQAKWGVMTHYLSDLIAKNSGISMTVEKWNELVDHFDTEGIAGQLQAAGAGYYQISIGQNSGFYLAPNATYDRLTGDSPSKCSRRDLVADLYMALHKRGIKLMVYLPSGAPGEDAAADRALEWRDGPYRNREFQEKWQQVVREWSMRWGARVSGWWFDGCYFPNSMYRGDAPNFETFAAAARAGNPNAAIAFNQGVFNRLFGMSPQQDFTAGEINEPADIVIKRAEGEKIDGVRVHVLSYLGKTWGSGQPRFSVEEAASYSKKVRDEGGVITWDVPVQVNGLIAEPFGRQLKAIGEAMRQAK